MARKSISVLWGILGKITAVITITAIVGIKAHMIESQTAQQDIAHSKAAHTIALSK